MTEKPGDNQDVGKPADEQAENTTPQPGEEKTFRVKDQFGSLENIQPTAPRNQTASPKAPAPKAPAPTASTPTASTPAANASSAGPVRSIRREIDLRDFFVNLDFIKIMRGVYRRFWVIFLCAVVMLLLFLPLAHHFKGGQSYSAESAIIYTKPSQKQIDTQGSSFLLRPLSQNTLVDMLFSQINIRKLEEFTGFEPLRKSVSFDNQSKSDIITLTVNNMPDEATAISAANKLAEIIIGNNALYYQQLASAAYDQFHAQRIIEEKEMTEASEAVEKFQLKNQLMELNTQYQNFFSSKNAASERLSIANVAHEGLIVRIKNYEEMIAELPDEVLDSAEEDNPLKREISNAEASLLQARIQYAADNPKILRQERHIKELRNMLQSGDFDSTRERTYVENPLKSELQGELMKLRAEEKVAVQQISALKKDLETLNERFKELPSLGKKYAALLERRAQADANYKTLKASEDAAQMTRTADLSDFRILNPATSAEMSGSSLLGKIIPLAGFIFGFFGGLILVLLFELLDAKIRTQQQLEKAYDAPCLASIVELPGLESYDSYELLLPSLREISERLNVLLQGQKRKVLGLLSSLDEEGKSTLSFNLARYYSSLGIHVLHVSFDTRPNPCLPRAADIAWPQMGIEDYLRGTAQLPDMLSCVEGVDILQVQNQGSDMMDLAKGPAMQRLWNLLRENYDLIITDIPSVLDHPISGTLSGFQDQLVYVLASPISDRKLVDAGLEFIEARGFAPCAILFNRVNPYYLEDIRQQRIIRNLSDNGGPPTHAMNVVNKAADKARESIKKEPETPSPDEDPEGLDVLTEEEEMHFNQWLNKSDAEDSTDDEK